MDNLTNFLKKDSSDQVDKTEIQNNYESETDITKKSEDFIKNFKVKGYIPPTKNDWLPFILNCFYYIVLVLIIGIIGANLNILSEGMHKTKNGNSGLENKLRKIFPHTQFAMDILRIDESVDPYPQKVGKKEFPYDSWCSICDLAVQIRLLFIQWPLKIFDASNYMMFTLLSSFITKYIKTSGVLKNFMIPILLGILIYLQVPVMISLVAALYSSTLHPHFLQYWAGIFLSWKYVKKYVKAFLKIITGLKKISNVSGVASRLVNATGGRENAGLGEMIEKYATMPPSDDATMTTTVNLAEYLEDMEKLNTSSLSDNLSKIIYQSIKNNYTEKFASEKALDDIRVIKNKIIDGEELKPKNNSDYKNLKFLVELYVFEHYQIKEDTTSPSRKITRKRLRNIIDDNRDNRIEAHRILLQIMKNLEDDGLLFVDVLIRNKTYIIKDGMWSWKEWKTRTGQGVIETEQGLSEVEQADAKSAAERDAKVAYEIYKQKYKQKKAKIIRKLKKQRKTNQRNYDWVAWTIMIICIILQTFKYIIDYTNGTKTGDGEGLLTSNCGGGARGGGGAIKSSSLSALKTKLATVSGSNSSATKRNTTGMGSGLNSLSDKIAGREVLLKNSSSNVANVLSIIYMISDKIGHLFAGGRSLIGNVTNFATCNSDVMATIVSLLKFIAIYLIFGWWVTPTYGLGICIAYSLSTQMKIISLLMFSSLNKKYINATIDYLKNNRYGLTIMGLLMLSYSAMTFLRPNVAVGAFISLIVCSIIIICCL